MDHIKMAGPGFVNDVTAWWPGFVPNIFTNKQEPKQQKSTVTIAYTVIPPSSCKKQINKQNSYLLLASLQSGSVPELDMHESKHFLPGPFVHCEHCQKAKSNETLSPHLTQWMKFRARKPKIFHLST
jgi:hypothetical protein